MANRIELHEKFKEILKSNNVYFQPPKNVSMKYPAIRYSLSDIDVQYGNNTSYVKRRGYDVILITKDPDNLYIDKIMALPYTRFDRMYVSENLYHFVFTLYH